MLFGFIGKLCIPVSNIHPLTFTMKMAQYLKIDGSGGKLLAAYCENLSLSPQNHINLGASVHLYVQCVCGEVGAFWRQENSPKLLAC